MVLSLPSSQVFHDKVPTAVGWEAAGSQPTSASRLASSPRKKTKPTESHTLVFNASCTTNCVCCRWPRLCMRGSAWSRLVATVRAVTATHRPNSVGRTGVVAGVRLRTSFLRPRAPPRLWTRSSPIWAALMWRSYPPTA